MATEKLRAELELITKTAEKDLARFHRSLKSVEKTVASVGGKGGKSMRPLGEGLSAATANASEFEKSMAAANARVIAFGASAGLIIQVQKALKETVKSTIEVEKALTDINIVLNTSTAGLQKFGDQLFKIAGQTGQSFKTIATGATELARQGLGTEKTLGRLNDAMILSRLTGMGAEEAVSNLTAAVNSFNKSGITSAQVINKMAKVDQAFAVSSDDLAKAISRVGSSAVDAGVSMDQLLAITTAVQQRTARGGAVIGNAFKTIFTRIGRTDVQKKLAAIGVATRDMQGQMLPATKVLENLADKFQHLGQMQQNQIAESVAGVFQVNILRATLGDLSSQYGVYSRALKESASATDEAYQKNEKLNETLDALVNKSLANLTKAGSAIGGATLKPAIENVLNLVNSAIEAFGEGGRFEEFGKGLGKDLLAGIGNFISGPGLAIITIGIGKLAINFASFAKTAIAGVLELNKRALARKGIEDSVTASLMRQPGIIKQIERGELSAAAAAKDMLAAMRAQNMEASKLAVTSRAIAGNMMGVGMGARGGRGGGRPGMASGFVPSFADADADAERASAASGGYKAGVIKTMNVPGEGSMMYNGAETVKRFPGMTQPAIMPPKESPAGANYKSAFGAAHGFDPYAADGFIPNFPKGWTDPGNLRNNQVAYRVGAGDMTREYAHEKYNYKGTAGLGLTQHQKNEYNKKGAKDSVKEFLDVKGQLGVVSLYGASQGVATNRTATMSVGQLGVFKEHVAKHPEIAKERIRFGGIQVSTLKGLEKNLKKEKKPSFASLINKHLIPPLANIGAELVGTSLGNQADPIGTIKRKMEGQSLLPKQSEGELFETAIKLALHSPKRFMQSMGDSPTAPFDFEEGTSPTKTFKKRLGFRSSLIRADAKRTSDSAAVNSLVKKAYNQHILIKEGLAKGPLLGAMGGGAFGKSPMVLPMTGKRYINQGEAFKRLKGTARPGEAHGFVPNFSPLGDAITRERAAGVPVSAIRVSSNPALKGPGNPGGLGVHNTIDEPAGLGQGISRSRKMGINPKTHGASGGFVPNFPAFDAIPAPAKRASYSIPIIGSSPSSPSSPVVPPRHSAYHESWMEFKKSKMESGEKGWRTGEKIYKSSEKFNAGAGKFSKGVDKLVAKGGPMAMMGMTAAFMAGPAIERKFGPGSQEKMNAGMTAMMAGGGVWALGAGAAGMADSSMRRMRKRGAGGGSKGGKVSQWLTKASRNKWVKRAPKVGKPVAAALAALASVTTFNMMQTPPEQLEFEKAMEDASSKREKLGVASGAVEALSGSTGRATQNRDTMTDAQIRTAYHEVVKQKGDVLKTAPEGVDSAITAEIGLAYDEFSRALLDDSKDLETAEKRASKSLAALTKNISELNEATSNKEALAAAKLALKENEDTVESFKTEFGKDNQRLFGDGDPAPFNFDKEEAHLFPDKRAKSAINKATSRDLNEQEMEALFIKHFGEEGANLLENNGDLGGWGWDWLSAVPGGWKEDAYKPGTKPGFIQGFGQDMTQHSGLLSWLNPVADAEDIYQGGKNLLTGDTQETKSIDLQRRFGRTPGDDASDKYNQALKAFKADLNKGLDVREEATLSDEQRDLLKGAMNQLFNPEVRKKFIKAQFGEMDTGGLDKKSYDDMLFAANVQIRALKKHLVEDPLSDPDKPGSPIKDLLNLKDKEGKDVFKFKDVGTYLANMLPPAAKAAVMQMFIDTLSAPDMAHRMTERDKTPTVTRNLENLYPLAMKGLQQKHLAVEQKRAVDLLKARNNNTEKLIKIEEDLALVEAKATKDAEAVAAVDLKIAKERTKRKYERLSAELDETTDGKVTEAKGEWTMALLQAKYKSPQAAVKAGKTAKELEDILKAHETQYSQTINGFSEPFGDLGNWLTRTELQKRLASATVKAGQNLKNPEDAAFAAAEKKLTEQALKIFEIRVEATHIQKSYNEGKISEIERDKKLGELREKQLELESVYNRDAELRNRRNRASIATQAAKWSEKDFATGRISGSKWASIQRAERQALRDEGGLNGMMVKNSDGKDVWAPGAKQASIGTIFREEWKYGPRQQVDDFEAGMADVAVTVKDSLKDAIKNIASGADSFKDAMFNVFAAVADKLANQGISMGVDSMFHWLSRIGQNKDGGYIPRGYNQGGVVTGGSGVRDDVMTRMQGGEYVIKKSAAQKIGYETLGAINSYAGGGQARVSLAKEFLYTGDDPRRPTGGNYNVSRNLSTAALFREDDPQTSEMFGRQSTLTSYLEYRRKEQERRDKILDGIKQQKRQRLTSAYMSAAMRIGVAKYGEHLEAKNIGSTGGGDSFNPGTPVELDSAGNLPRNTTLGNPWKASSDGFGFDNARGGSPAMVMGGEYIMSPRTVSKYGTGFMSQLNQGRLPSFQSGGLVGGGAAMAAGITTNNVSLSVNIDKSGGATAETGGGSKSEAKNDERGDAEEAQRNKEFAEAIRGAVLKEITKQQRPGGLLRDGATWAAGRRA